MVLFGEDYVTSHAAGCVVFPICAALAMSAGIGGGGLFVPLLMIILGKSVAEATSMSQCLIAGAAIAGLAYNSQQSHPTRQRPLILLDAVVFFAPLQMSGALMGNVLNQMMPKYLVVMTLVVVLILSATKSYFKGLDLYKKEGKEGNRAQKLDDDVIQEPPNRARSAKHPSSGKWMETANSDGYQLPSDYASDGMPTRSYTVVEMETVNQSTPSKNIGSPDGSMAGEIKAEDGDGMRHRNKSPAMSPNLKPTAGERASSAAYAMLRQFQSPKLSSIVHAKFLKKSGGESVKDLMASIYEDEKDENAAAVNRSPQYKSITDDELGTAAELECLSQREEEEFGALKGHAENLDMKKSALLFGVWLMTLVLIFARGGKGADSVFGLKYCGGGYWGVSGIAVIGLMCFAASVGRDLISDTRAKQESGYMFAEGDLIWTPKLVIQLAVTTIFAGIMAGLVGIGGGMVLGPVLLEAGYIPQVSSALTATNVLLSSTTVGVLVLVSGVVPIDEAMFFFGICMLGAFLGKFYLGKVIKRIGRTSIIIFTLVGVICLSIVAVLAKSIPVWATDGFVGKFTAVCSDV